MGRMADCRGTFITISAKLVDRNGVYSLGALDEAMSYFSEYIVQFILFAKVSCMLLWVPCLK